MRSLIIAAVCLFSFSPSFSQKSKIQPKKYPSLLWEITGNGLAKPSYLFGTMHVSSKMVFHLSDSFYLALKNADVVALETDPGTWQDDFSRYDMGGQDLYGMASRMRNSASAPQDYLTINTLQFFPYEKLIELALYTSPSIVNSFLYRSNSEKSSDFEEDTYLDLHIYQVGKKWGKKLCGVENFDQSMQLMKEAYVDASREKNKKEKSFDVDEDFSYARLEEAYRTGNLDLLDTINKVNSTSAAFDEKFLYRRDDIQANSIDSILKTKASLFVGVGAAHLPGQRGVIELLRRKGYKLRPIKMSERNSKWKEEIEKIRVPVQFNRQTSDDNFFSVDMPGRLYGFSNALGFANQQQYADMINGSYYMVTRINTNAALWGHNPDIVQRKIDSVIYENIPGKILSKQSIVKNGYNGFDVTNRTRRGDFQRYNIFVTPFEIVLFKMSGNNDYVKEGKEADRFFNSIELRQYKNEWQKYSPSFGGFEVEMPHQPVIARQLNWQFMATDEQTGDVFEIIRSDIHNYQFAEEDSFELNLMEESFGTSEFIDKQLARRHTVDHGYPVLETKFRYKDGSVALVRFLIQGTHYYTLISHGKTENARMDEFLRSFKIVPFIYPRPEKLTDTSLYYVVASPVPLERKRKLSLYPEELYSYGGMQKDEEAFLEESGTYKHRLVANDSTGEKIYVSFSKQSRYYFKQDTSRTADSTHFKTEAEDWVFRSRKRYLLPDKTKVLEYTIGDPKSSRMVQGKLFSKDGVDYRMETEGDTLSAQSSFISSFFNSFTPSDTVRGTDIRVKKTGLFLADFFSKDTLLHKRAVKNIDQVEFDSSDFAQLKKMIASLSWKEKKYIDVKKDFLGKLSSISTREASDFLKDAYYAAGDTVELQYTALEALLQQKTIYAFKIFKDIMTNEPPVLDIGKTTTVFRPNMRDIVFNTANMRRLDNYNLSADDENTKNGSFLDDLTDSLQLTAAIFKDILPLINIHDYEQPVMDLMGTLIDSNMIHSADYELYLSKFIIEAKQQLKKQLINEKNRSIEKAQKDPDERASDRNDVKDAGNSQLSLYATLLLPFWDKNPAVPAFIKQLLNSSDNRLKYNTVILLLRNKMPVPDTMLSYFAGRDNYRYELYTDLKKSRLLQLFPVAYNNQVDLAKSKLLSIHSYYTPDSVIYLDKLPVFHKERKGLVYFFKYKQKKDDNAWKLASVGIVSSDPRQFEFDKKENTRDEMEYNFTDIDGTKISSDQPIQDQLKKALKKLEYSKRKSASEFYGDDNKMSLNFLKGFATGE